MSDDYWLKVLTPMPTDSTATDGVQYNSIRLADDRLDSSPVELRVQLSDRALAPFRAAARDGASGSASLLSDPTARALGQALSIEVVMYNGEQVLIYCDDRPHLLPFPPLNVSVRSLVDSGTAGGTAIVHVQRNFPLSSSHMGARFRLAVYLSVPGSAEGQAATPLLFFTESFRVLAKMGRRGSRQKQVHVPRYVQLDAGRAQSFARILAAAAQPALREALEGALGRPLPVPAAVSAAPLPLPVAAAAASAQQPLPLWVAGAAPLLALAGAHLPRAAAHNYGPAAAGPDSGTTRRAANRHRAPSARKRRRGDRCSSSDASSGGGEFDSDLLPDDDQRGEGEEATAGEEASEGESRAAPVDGGGAATGRGRVGAAWRGAAAAEAEAAGQRYGLGTRSSARLLRTPGAALGASEGRGTARQSIDTMAMDGPSSSTAEALDLAAITGGGSTATASAMEIASATGGSGGSSRRVDAQAATAAAAGAFPLRRASGRGAAAAAATAPPKSLQRVLPPSSKRRRFEVRAVDGAVGTTDGAEPAAARPSSATLDAKARAAESAASSRSLDEAAGIDGGGGGFNGGFSVMYAHLLAGVEGGGTPSPSDAAAGATTAGAAAAEGEGGRARADDENSGSSCGTFAAAAAAAKGEGEAPPQPQPSPTRFTGAATMLQPAPSAVVSASRLLAAAAVAAAAGGGSGGATKPGSIARLLPRAQRLTQQPPPHAQVQEPGTAAAAETEALATAPLEEERGGLLLSPLPSPPGGGMCMGADSAAIAPLQQRYPGLPGKAKVCSIAAYPGLPGNAAAMVEAAMDADDADIDADDAALPTLARPPLHEPPPALMRALPGAMARQQMQQLLLRPTGGGGLVPSQSTVSRANSLLPPPPPLSQLSQSDGGGASSHLPTGPPHWPPLASASTSLRQSMALEPAGLVSAASSDTLAPPPQQLLPPAFPHGRLPSLGADSDGSALLLSL